MTNTPTDLSTAQAFASSWNNLPEGSVYTTEQALDWFTPLKPEDFEGRRVLELGCGNGSLLVHVAQWHPQEIEGVDLGDSVLSAQKNLSGHTNTKITKADLVDFKSEGFEIVYSIGVLHHLKNPEAGFQSVVRNTKSGGRFHCWVYAKEGNLVVRLFVEPLRRIFCHAPWWVTKYLVATPLAVPFYLYAQLVSLLWNLPFTSKLPMALYMKWISRRDFFFCRHVAFDQLVTPQTTYISRAEIQQWLGKQKDLIGTYIIARNGNSWKFGGTVPGPR